MKQDKNYSNMVENFSNIIFSKYTTYIVIKSVNKVINNRLYRA